MRPNHGERTFGAFVKRLNAAHSVLQHLNIAEDCGQRRFEFVGRYRQKLIAHHHRCFCIAPRFNEFGHVHRMDKHAGDCVVPIPQWRVDKVYKRLFQRIAALAIEQHRHFFANERYAASVHSIQQFKKALTSYFWQGFAHRLPNRILTTNELVIAWVGEGENVLRPFNGANCRWCLMQNPQQPFAFGFGGLLRFKRQVQHALTFLLQSAAVANIGRIRNYAGNRAIRCPQCPIRDVKIGFLQGPRLITIQHCQHFASPVRLAGRIHPIQ